MSQCPSGCRRCFRRMIGSALERISRQWNSAGRAVCLVCRLSGLGIYEVRTTSSQNRIARVLSHIDKDSRMILLHGFIKKTQKTPGEDLDLARSNKSKHQSGSK